MFDQLSGFPLAGGALLAAGIYAGASLFVTGPIVGERTIIKSGWAESCPRHIRDQAESRQPSVTKLPNIDCSAILGTVYGREGEAFCRRYGSALPFGNLLGDLGRMQGDANQSRIARAASMATTRCDCAANVVLEERRSAFAIYAGSLRLIAPRPIKALGSELDVALNSSSCAMKE